eukprot:Rhum_TRINITY_DN14808_c0_g1::Rhum_TRINITY_DN14808_c0_g1_i5::g.119713::m.119713
MAGQPPSMPPTWWSIDPRTAVETQYSAPVTQQLEQEYQAPTTGVVQVSISGLNFDVDITNMFQSSATGGFRSVIRKEGTTAGVVWYSNSPHHGGRDPYAPADAAKLEAAFQAFQNGGSPKVSLSIFALDFTVDLREMRQYNAIGSFRSVVRDDSASASSTPAAASPKPKPVTAPPSAAGAPPVPAPASAPAVAAPVVAPAQGTGAPLCKYGRALEVVALVEPIVASIQAKPLDTALVDSLSQQAHRVIESLYEEILAEIKREKWLREKFGAANLTKDDEDLFGIPVGAQVPNYYANIVSETIYRRKVLSLLGLRNLVRSGARIFSDMQQTLFAGDTSLYKNGEGLMLMRHLTGNTVDLDEVVLRCDKDTLKHINASNRKDGEPVFNSVDDFAQSSQAQKIALSSARNVLDLFSTKLGLTTDQRKSRKVFLADGDFHFPRAAGHSDRGKYAAWMYTIGPTTSFHANAPNLPDVIGSLLLAPWHAIKAYCLLCTRFHGDELRQKKSEFYEDCIDDSCFNGKWKSIERFLQNMADESTLRHLIGKCEQDNQNRLMAAADLSDDDYVDALFAVAKEKRLRGLNTKGVNAEVTRQDVYAYVCEAPPAPSS